MSNPIHHDALPHSRPQPNDLLVVAGLTLLAFALRLYRLGAIEFWFDEAASYFIAFRDYAAIIDYLRHATGEHPPVYYLALNIWMQWTGTNEFSMRYLSLLLGVLFVPLLYYFARREFGVTIGLGAALAAAASPFMVIYSQEARMYTLLPVLGLLAMVFFLRAVRAGHPRDWAAFFIVSLLGVTTHYYFALTFFAEFLFVCIRWRLLPRRFWLAASVLAVLLASLLVGWVLFMPGLFSTLSNTVGDTQIPAWNERVERVTQDLALGQPFGAQPDIWLRLLAVSIWLIVLYGLHTAVTKERQNYARDGAAATMLVALAAGALLGVIILPQGVVGRQAAVVIPAFLIALIVGLAEMHRRRPILGTLAFTCTLLLFAAGIANQLVADKGDLGMAFNVLAREAQSNDAVLLAQPRLWPHIMYYYHRADVPIYFLPEIPTQILSDRPITLPAEEIIAFMQKAAREHTRLWLGPTGEHTTDIDNLMMQWLADTAFAAQSHYFHAISFTQFITGQPPTQPVTGHLKFGEHIRMDAAFINTTQRKSGEPLLLTLQWQTDARLPSDDLVVLKLVDERGQVHAVHQMLPCGGHCLTSDWPINETIDDRHAFTIPSGTPPGEYRLMIELYDPARRGPLLVRGNASAPELARVQVLPDPQAAPPRIAQPLAVRFGDGLRLLGMDGAPSAARAGDSWPVDVIWGADAPVPTDVMAVFQWLNARDEVISEVPAPIGTRTYPPFAWQPGEIIRQHYDVPLPRTTLPALQLALQVRDARTSLALPPSLPNGDAWTLSPQPRATLATVQVRQIERRFIAPEVIHTADAHFADQFALVGYDMAQPTRGKLDVTLHWRALAPPPTNYKVFVHLLSDDDRVLAQHDGQPANESRPTRGWMFGEFVADEHRISLNEVPPGTYRIEVGLYDPVSGQRLPVFVQHVPQPDDRILLTAVRVP